MVLLVNMCLAFYVPLLASVISVPFIAVTKGYDARKTASYTTGEGEEGHATIPDRKRGVVISCSRLTI